MKKLIIPAIAATIAFTTIAAHAETMKGKIVSKQNNTIQVQGEGESAPKTLKTNNNTSYYVKKKLTKNGMQNDSMPEVNEIVEIIYTVDPATNEMIIDEIIMMID